SAERVAQDASQDAAQKVKADRDAEQSKNTGGYLAGLKAEGFDNLTADQVIAMKIQGVTPEYIHEIRALGLHPRSGSDSAIHPRYACGWHRREDRRTHRHEGARHHA